MNATTFITKVESSYKGGTYRPYMYTKPMDLYALKNRATDNGNTITEVIKVTNSVGRLVTYGNIKTVIRDSLIRDLCVGLYTNETKRKCFSLAYGNAVDLDSYSIKELEEMVKKFSYIGAHKDDPMAKPRTSVKPDEQKSKKLDSSKYLWVTPEGTYTMQVMTALNHMCRSTSTYIVTEQTPDGQTITKTMTPKEFAALGQVAKTYDTPSYRFPKSSSYTALVEMNVIKDINAPAKVTVMTLKLDRIQQFANITD